MHSGIQKLELFVQDHPSETFFEEIVDRMPNLSDLHITIYSVSTVRIVEDLAKLLQQLPNLHQITLPRFCYAARIFEVLSRLQLLCTIKFSEFGSGAGSLDTWPESFRPTMISEGAFSTLQNLSVTTNYDSIASLLQSSFTPSALTYFNINSVIVEMPNSLHKLVFMVSKRFQELKRLCLDSARDYAIEDFTDTDGPGRNITLQTLKPLFKLPYLTSFEFYHQYPLIITQKDIETIASSCPAIEKLELCSNPVFCMKSALTLEALIPLAQHCTQLKSLGLFIDATRMPEISPEIPPKPFTSLRILLFGLSIINDAMPTVLVCLPFTADPPGVCDLQFRCMAARST